MEAAALSTFLVHSTAFLSANSEATETPTTIQTIPPVTTGVFLFLYLAHIMMTSPHIFAVISSQLLEAL
jgi:hypothetical protein